MSSGFRGGYGGGMPGAWAFSGGDRGAGMRPTSGPGPSPNPNPYSSTAPGTAASQLPWSHTAPQAQPAYGSFVFGPGTQNQVSQAPHYQAGSGYASQPSHSSNSIPDRMALAPGTLGVGANTGNMKPLNAAQGVGQGQTLSHIVDSNAGPANQPANPGSRLKVANSLPQALVTALALLGRSQGAGPKSDKTLSDRLQVSPQSQVNLPTGRDSQPARAMDWNRLTEEFISETKQREQNILPDSSRAHHKTHSEPYFKGHSQKLNLSEKGQKESGGVEIINCDVCSMQFSNPRAYYLHTQGMLHSKKVQDAKNPDASFEDSRSAEDTEKAKDRFYCGVCDVRESDQMAYDSHLSHPSHSRQYLMQQHDLGFVEFNRRFHDVLYTLQQAHDGANSAPEETDTLFQQLDLDDLQKVLYKQYLLRSGALNNYICKICRHDSKRSSHRWCDHILGIGHRECCKNLVSDKGWQWFLKQYGDIPSPYFVKEPKEAMNRLPAPVPGLHAKTGRAMHSQTAPGPSGPPGAPGPHNQGRILANVPSGSNRNPNQYMGGRNNPGSSRGTEVNRFPGNNIESHKTHQPSFPGRGGPTQPLGFEGNRKGLSNPWNRNLPPERSNIGKPIVLDYGHSRNASAKWDGPRDSRHSENQPLPPSQQQKQPSGHQNNPIQIDEDSSTSSANPARNRDRSIPAIIAEQARKKEQEKSAKDTYPLKYFARPESSPQKPAVNSDMLSQSQGKKEPPAKQPPFDGASNRSRQQNSGQNVGGHRDKSRSPHRSDSNRHQHKKDKSPTTVQKGGSSRQTEKKQDNHKDKSGNSKVKPGASSANQNDPKKNGSLKSERPISSKDSGKQTSKDDSKALAKDSSKETTNAAKLEKSTDNAVQDTLAMVNVLLQKLQQQDPDALAAAGIKLTAGTTTPGTDQARNVEDRKKSQKNVDEASSQKTEEAMKMEDKSKTDNKILSDVSKKNNSNTGDTKLDNTVKTNANLKSGQDHPLTAGTREKTAASSKGTTTGKTTVTGRNTSGISPNKTTVVKKEDGSNEMKGKSSTSGLKGSSGKLEENTKFGNGTGAAKNQVKQQPNVVDTKGGSATSKGSVLSTDSRKRTHPVEEGPVGGKKGNFSRDGQKTSVHPTGNKESGATSSHSGASCKDVDYRSNTKPTEKRSDSRSGKDGSSDRRQRDDRSAQDKDYRRRDHDERDSYSSRHDHDYRRRPGGSSNVKDVDYRSIAKDQDERRRPRDLDERRRPRDQDDRRHLRDQDDRRYPPRDLGEHRRSRDHDEHRNPRDRDERIGRSDILDQDERRHHIGGTRSSPGPSRSNRYRKGMLEDRLGTSRDSTNRGGAEAHHSGQRSPRSGGSTGYIGDGANSGRDSLAGGTLELLTRAATTFLRRLEQAEKLPADRVVNQDDMDMAKQMAGVLGLGEIMQLARGLSVLRTMDPGMVQVLGSLDPQVMQGLISGTMTVDELRRGIMTAGHPVPH